MVATGIIIIAAIVAVVVAGGVLFSTGTIGYNTLAPTQTGNQAGTQEESSQATDSGATQISTKETVTVETNKAGENVIEMSSSGFSPSSITIKKGDTVTFKTVDSGSYWPASAVHPTHTVYPGSGIDKCGTGAQIFDACGGIGEGQSWSFTFNEVGSWNYHNHLNPSNFGKIIVTE